MAEATKTEPRTHAERLVWLAEQMIDCPNAQGYPVKEPRQIGLANCSLCQGTGKVARFPTLRQECPALFGPDMFPPRVTRDALGRFLAKSKHYFIRTPKTQTHAIPEIAQWCKCQGRGWVPVDDLKATMEAISALVAFDCTRQGWACNLWPGIEDGGWTTWCETPNEAAISALYKCMIAETKP